MPTVLMSAETKKELQALLRAEGSPKACLMVHKNGPKADSKRTTDGSTAWSIARPSNPWGAHVVSGEELTTDDVLVIDGLRFWFAVLEPEKVPPLTLSVAEGKLHVHVAT
jgi:hypothetical protein